MKPNGRRAWRAAAKKLRRELGRRWRSPEPEWSGKRWSELVPDLETHRAHVAGAWFKRHGFQSFDSELSSRHYIGLWGTVDGDGVEFVVKPHLFTARSLVGMPQGARKRRWAKDYDAQPQSGRASKTVSMLRSYGIYPKDGNPLAQRVRPCQGCEECRGYDGDIGVIHCDGSGVLPARKAKR